MSLNESIVEDTTLEWFLLRQGYGGLVEEYSRADRTLTRPLPREKSGVRPFGGYPRSFLRRREQLFSIWN